MAASASLCFVSAAATEPVFNQIKYENNQIMTRMTVADSLPAELVTYINKGVPVLFVYNIGLWRERAGWFDELRSRAEISYKVRYDSWDKEYSVVQVSGDSIIENLLRGERETIDLLRSTGAVHFDSPDTAGIFYLTGELSIKTMSFSNFKEVESWLKGEISDVKKPDLKEAPSEIGEFVFDMALKISGIKNASKAIRSRKFRFDGMSIIYLE